MKNKAIRICTIALALLASQWGYCLAQSARLIPEEIERQVSLPEDKLDLGITALMLAKEIYPSIDVQRYSNRIDVIASEARLLIARQPKQDPDSIIRALNTHFFKVYGMRYDKSLNAWEKQFNYYLNGILDTKQGICLTMPLLYMTVAQRLGYPIYPVSIPEHVFLRYVSTGLKEPNIEATGGGGFIPDDQYIKESRLTFTGISSGAYLRTQTKREFVAGLLDTHAVTLSKLGQLEKSVAYLEKAVALNPKCAGCFYNLGANYAALVTRFGQIHLEPKIEQAWKKTRELGYVKPFNDRKDLLERLNK